MHDTRRLHERDDRAHGTSAVELEITAFVAEWQSTRQIAIEARQTGGDHLELRINDAPREIDEREYDIRADVTSPPAESPLREPVRTAMTVRRVPMRVQRLEALRLPGLRRDGDHIIDGEHLRRDAPMCVRHERVLMSPLREQQWLSDLREEIDDRCAAQADRRCTHAGFEHVSPIGALERADRNDDLDTAARTCLAQCVEASKIEEQVLLREREILLQQAIRLK